MRKNNQEHKSGMVWFFLKVRKSALTRYMSRFVSPIARASAKDLLHLNPGWTNYRLRCLKRISNCQLGGKSSKNCIKTSYKITSSRKGHLARSTLHKTSWITKVSGTTSKHLHERNLPMIFLTLPKQIFCKLAAFKGPLKAKTCFS